MRIENLSEPFFHSIVYDFYNPEEEKLIWQELEFLNKLGKLLPPSETGDANSSPNKVGVFLDRLYKNNENFSNILTVNRKIFKIKHLLSKNPFSRYLTIIDKDLTMVSYYEDESYYLPHHDSYILSSVTTFWRKPKMFSGGQLGFVEYNYFPEMDHNTMILFPSYERHEVSEIQMEENDGINGRYTINQFYTIIEGVYSGD
jgi:Rps23 Pro-64 3,4-dihydroxylase Tpa1-like proline 4-hydroxylase